MNTPADTPEQQAEIQRALRVLRWEVEVAIKNARSDDWRDQYLTILQIVEDYIRDDARDMIGKELNRLSYFMIDSYCASKYIEDKTWEAIRKITKIRST